MKFHNVNNTNALKTASPNAGTFKGRSSEVAETISRRGNDLCWTQECR